MSKVRALVEKNRNTLADRTPRPTKTTEKPRTNSSDPATIRPRRTSPDGEVGAGQAGGVGQVAGQQRQHARGEEGDQPGQHGHRDRQDQRAGPGGLLEPVSHAQPSSATTSSIDVAQRHGAGDLAEDQRREPALAGPGRPCSAGCRRRACRRSRAGPRRRGRRTRGSRRPAPRMKRLRVVGAGVADVDPEETATSSGSYARPASPSSGISWRHGGAPDHQTLSDDHLAAVVLEVEVVAVQVLAAGRRPGRPGPPARPR